MLVVFWIVRKEPVCTFWEEIIPGAAVPPFQCPDEDVSAGTGGGMEVGKAGAQMGGCLVSKAQRAGRQKQSEDHVKKTDRRTEGLRGWPETAMVHFHGPHFSKVTLMELCYSNVYINIQFALI